MKRYERYLKKINLNFEKDVVKIWKRYWWVEKILEEKEIDLFWKGFENNLKRIKKKGLWIKIHLISFEKGFEKLGFVTCLCKKSWIET